MGSTKICLVLNHVYNEKISNYHVSLIPPSWPTQIFQKYPICIAYLKKHIAEN